MSDNSNDISEGPDDIEDGPVNEYELLSGRINRHVFSAASKQILRQPSWINDFVDRSCENGSVIFESVVDSNGE